MSDRILKINENIRHELSQLLLREVEFPTGCIVTITDVSTSKDLRHARVWISILPANFTGTVLELLRRNVGQLQFQLNERLTTRPLPRIAFAVDDGERRAADIDELLDQIKKPG